MFFLGRLACGCAFGLGDLGGVLEDVSAFLGLLGDWLWDGRGVGMRFSSDLGFQEVASEGQEVELGLECGRIFIRDILAFLDASKVKRVVFEPGDTGLDTGEDSIKVALLGKEGLVKTGF